MEVVATAKYIHQSPRKIRLVTSAVASMKPAEAMAHMQIMDKKAAAAVSSVLQSAIANATNNFNLNEESLRIKTLEVGEAPTMKRVSARSRGRASTMLRRMSHIRVVLTDEPVVLGKRRAAAAAAKQASRADRSWVKAESDKKIEANTTKEEVTEVAAEAPSEVTQE